MCVQVRDPEDGYDQGGGHPRHRRHRLHQRLRTLPRMSGSVAEEKEESLFGTIE